MLFKAYQDGQEIGREQIFSIGGGNLAHEGESSTAEVSTYPYQNFAEIHQDAQEKVWSFGS